MRSMRKCLYGLNDGARNFFLSVKDCLLNIHCVQSKLDPAIFYYFRDGFQGIICCHVDDFLHAGTEEFELKVMNMLTKRFTSGKVEVRKFRYIGFEIEMLSEDGGIVMDQNAYVQDIDCGTMSVQRVSQKPENLSVHEQTILRQLVGKMNWIAHGTRPDIIFENIDLSTKLKAGTVADLVRARKIVRNIMQSDTSVLFPRLSPRVRTWTIVVYTDASHANICNGTGSVGAYVIFLTDGVVYCPLDWHANKIKRVVRSTLAAETLSLQVGYEAAYYLNCIIEEMTGYKCVMYALVDNKSIVESIHLTSMVDDKRLRIDVASLKENIGLDF